jgi:thioredoxin reductase (NADPH)
VFVMVGAAPNTGWLSELVDLDAKGFVLTDANHATSCPGIFAVRRRAGHIGQTRGVSGGRRLCRCLKSSGDHVAGDTAH